MPICAPSSTTRAWSSAGRGRAAAVVDVEAVGRDADRDHLRAELPQRGGRDLVGGAVRAIDDDLEAVEPQMLGKGGLGEVDVAAARILDLAGAADLGGAASFGSSSSIASICGSSRRTACSRRAEQLDAVVVEGIVAGRDHHAEIGAHRAGEHRDAGVGTGPTITTSMPTLVKPEISADSIM
jgi:hypothetical protein